MITKTNITAEALDALREKLPGMMSEKRLRHVLEVEKMAVRLGKILLPGEENEMILRAAALLHDITKEYSVADHLKIASTVGQMPTPLEISAPKTLHAITAAALIPLKYPEFAYDAVIRAVRWHTTGRADMSMEEKIVYLADYIDESRTFPECVRLRDEFFGAEPEKMDADELDRHLRRVLIDSFDVTLRGLLDDGLPVHPDTTAARNHLIMEA